jgi:hypothetical protein
MIDIEEKIEAALKALLLLGKEDGILNDTSSKMTRSQKAHVYEQKMFSLFIREVKLSQDKGVVLPEKIPTELMSLGIIDCSLTTADGCERIHRIKFKALTPTQESCSSIFKKLFGGGSHPNYLGHVREPYRYSAGRLPIIESKYSAAISSVSKADKPAVRVRIFLLDTNKEIIHIYDASDAVVPIRKIDCTVATNET